MRQVHGADLDAGHQLGFLDRFLDRLDRRLEIDDDAALEAFRVGDADADDVDAAVVEHLADHRADLGRADVEPHHVSFLSCHESSRSYRLRRALAGAGRTGPHVQPFVEPQIHVVDRRSTARAAPAPDRCIAAGGPRSSASPSRSNAVSSSRITTASWRSATSICDTAWPAPAASASAAITRPANSARAHVDDRRAVLGRRRQPVDDRQIEVGVSGPVLVDDHAVSRR